MISLNNWYFVHQFFFTFGHSDWVLHSVHWQRKPPGYSNSSKTASGLPHVETVGLFDSFHFREVLIFKKKLLPGWKLKVFFWSIKNKLRNWKVHKIKPNIFSQSDEVTSKFYMQSIHWKFHYFKKNHVSFI